MKGNVALNGALVSGNSRIRGSVVANDHSYYNAWKTTVAGNVAFHNAWGGWISESRIKRNLDADYYSRVVVGDWTTVDGNLHMGTAYGVKGVEKVIVGGDFNLDGVFAAAASNIRVGGDAKLDARGGASLSNSTVGGSTLLYASLGDVRLTDSKVNNLLVRGPGRVSPGHVAEIDRNRVYGTADAPCDDDDDGGIKLTGSGNSFYGPLKGQFAQVFGGASGCTDSVTVKPKAATQKTSKPKVEKGAGKVDNAKSVATMKAKSAAVVKSATAAGKVTVSRG